MPLSTKDLTSGQNGSTSVQQRDVPKKSTSRYEKSSECKPWSSGNPANSKPKPA